jgi:glycosyltransferase involved in cell wall biosynthesis
MNSPPLVSVLIPTFNQAAYIGAAVESALSQTWPSVEVIVSDNHSTDGTAAVLESHADARLRVIRPAAHVTMFSNFQHAAEAAGGRYVVFLSSDDTLRPEFISTLVQHLETDSRLAYAYAACELIDKDGKRRGTSRHRSGPWRREGAAELRRAIGGHRGIFTAMLIRREDFTAAGGFDARFQIAGDWSLILRLLAQGDVMYVDRELAQYRLWNTPDRDSRIARHVEEVVWMYESGMTAFVDRGLVSREEVDRAMRRTMRRFRRQLARMPVATMEAAIRTVEQHGGALGFTDRAYLAIRRFLRVVNR